MNDRTNLDRIRDELAGALSPREKDDLLRELEADPELAQFAEEYRLVDALTAHDGIAERRSSTTFAVLFAAQRTTRARDRRWRRAASIAAAVLGVTAGAWLVWRAKHSVDRQPVVLGAPVVLEAIGPWERVAGFATALAPLPSTWSEYDPTAHADVDWFTSVADATRLARAVERPLFVYGYYPGCPLAKALDRDVFTDASVIDIAQHFVPVRVDMSRMPEAEAEALMQRGYPFLEAWCVGADEKKLPLDRVYDPRRFETSLVGGLSECATPERAPAWPAFHELVRLFEDARASLVDGAPARAEASFEALSARAVESPFFAELAVLGLQSVARDAHERFYRARALASSDPRAAETELARAAELYAGTPYASDLRATLARVREDGAFPPVVAADEHAF